MGAQQRDKVNDNALVERTDGANDPKFFSTFLCFQHDDESK